jgi:hypothetical protein
VVQNFPVWCCGQSWIPAIAAGLKTERVPLPRRDLGVGAGDLLALFLHHPVEKNVVLKRVGPRDIVVIRLGQTDRARPWLAVGSSMATHLGGAPLPVHQIVKPLDHDRLYLGNGQCRNKHHCRTLEPLPPRCSLVRLRGFEWSAAP